MSEDAGKVTAKTQERSGGSGCAGWMPKALVCFVCLLVLLLIVPLELFYHLFFGWVHFLINAVPQATIQWKPILSSVLVLALAMVFLNRLGRRFIPTWSLRSTAAVTAVVVVLFASAISGTGIGHQMSWLGRGTVYSVERVRILTLMGCINRTWGDCLYYSRENGGKLPTTLRALGDHAVEPPLSPAFKAWWGADSEGLVYLGKGMSTDMKAHLPVVATPRPLPSSGFYLVCRLDGKTDKLDRTAYNTLMDEWRSEMSKRRGPAKVDD